MPARSRGEERRFEMDPDTSGLWDQVRGDLHRRFRRGYANGPALRVVSRVYLNLARRDPDNLRRILEVLQLEDQGLG